MKKNTYLSIKPVKLFLVFRLKLLEFPGLNYISLIDGLVKVEAEKLVVFEQTLLFSPSVRTGALLLLLHLVSHFFLIA